MNKEELENLIYCLKTHKSNFDYCLSELFFEIENLQDRIDKAVEYIRINKCNNNDINDCWHEDFKDILDILKGVDNT